MCLFHLSELAKWLWQGWRLNMIYISYQLLIPPPWSCVGENYSKLQCMVLQPVFSLLWTAVHGWCYIRKFKTHRILTKPYSIILVIYKRVSNRYQPTSIVSNQDIYNHPMDSRLKHGILKYCTISCYFVLCLK